jgi:excisionase family DNA binding protein
MNGTERFETEPALADVRAVDVLPRRAAVLPEPSPWLVATEAASYTRVSPKTIYREARLGRLRHARVGGRRELRFLRAWLDEWLVATSEPIEVRR